MAALKTSKQLPSRFRRLDEALAALPLDAPMRLTELDGYLTAIFVCPVLISSDDWLKNIWGVEQSGGPAVGNSTFTQWFAEAIIAQYEEIARNFERGTPQPIFDIDERNGDVLWEAWVSGFVEAMAWRPHTWAALADCDDPDVVAVMSRLWLLISIIRDDSSLDSREVNAAYDQAPEELTSSILCLHEARVRSGGISWRPAIKERIVKSRRNEVCLCGSNRKYKRCCGSASSLTTTRPNRKIGVALEHVTKAAV